MADIRKTSEQVFIVGVGMTKFEKPLTKKWDYPDMAREAGTAALNDAGISYQDVEAVVASYCYGEPTSGQRAVYDVEQNLKMDPKRKVFMFYVGFEKMERGLSEKYHDRESPVKRHMDHMVAIGAAPGLINPQLNTMTSDVVKLFAYAAQEHSKKYGSTFEQCAKISYKNHKHSVHNPNACLRKEIPFKGITHSKMICKPITFAMSAPTADGSAAAVVCSKEFMKSYQMQNKAVEIVAQQMVTDLPSSFEHSFLDLAGVAMARKAAADCYRSSGLTPYDVNVLEVHDCFSCNELFMYEAMGLCPQGRGGELIDSAEWITNTNGGEVCRIGGRWVVNPSGGLESKGHPIGATGLAQCAELNWQLRGEAGKRQVDGALVALQHNYGIGGAAVVTMYRKYKPEVKTQPHAKL
ncbi:non-specific lipid-transfer protein-like [Orbicella faveolata]|uniref:non-specific lipid-transfer protein-like n=1 Tax=Orbicella faveolata TaxID=48498 RepID=UPI0009E447F0|nr:non-specific lipid-transfer protein-like [Orbicella faveolata]